MAKWSDRRQAVADLNRLAANDLQRLLGDLTTAGSVREALRDVLPLLVQRYGQAAATLAANAYDDMRDEAAVAKRFTAIPAEVTKTGTDALIGWAAGEATDDQAFQSLVLGGVQRRIAKFDRLTIMQSSIADPSARGWQRVGVGECDFCRLLLGRGAVYSEDTADFQAHDHCGCTAEPAFI